MSRPHLADPALDAQYEVSGYTVIPGAARALVADLRGVHRRSGGPIEAGFHSTLYSPDTDRKRRVHRELLAAIQPLLDATLCGHRPLLCNFITKTRGPGGAMAPHQDWTFVDERVSSSMNLWIPLIDVDGRNGAMSVLPGGHRVPFTIRGSDTDNSFRDVAAEAAGRMVELPMRAGDVLVHDHRVLHSSPPNRRRRPRVVAGCALIAADARPIHYRQTRPGQMELHEIDEEFFVTHTFGADHLPASARLKSTVAFVNPVLGVMDLP